MATTEASKVSPRADVAVPPKEEVLAAMRQEIGQDSAPGEWFTVEQKLVDDFIAISGENGWLHTDRERAAQSKFGSTIAPGNMGIALLPRLSRAVSAYGRYPRKYSLNQGWDRIRFLEPMRVGRRIRALSRLLGVQERPDGSLRVEVEFRLEIEGYEKPWLSAVKVGRFFY
jgi:acyl dehydratase